MCADSMEGTQQVSLPFVHTIVIASIKDKQKNSIEKRSAAIVDVELEMDVDVDVEEEHTRVAEVLKIYLISMGACWPLTGYHQA